MNNNKLKTRYFSAYLLAALVSFINPTLGADSVVLDLPSGLACNFDLHIVVSGGNQQLKEFKDINGNLIRSISAGTGTALRFTNLSNDKTLTTKSNGAVSQTQYNPDGSYTVKGTGHNVLIMFPSDIPAGPTTTLYVGRLVYSVDLEGVFTLIESNGNHSDICASLT
jgi:hypothetical protein